MPITGVQTFTTAGVTRWNQIEEREIYGAELLDEGSGFPMSATWWRLGAGEQAPVTTPADEVWVVRSGVLTIRTDAQVARLGAGDVVVVPRGAPGVAEAEEESVFMVVANPPVWQLGEDDWAAVREE